MHLLCPEIVYQYYLWNVCAGLTEEGFLLIMRKLVKNLPEYFNHRVVSMVSALINCVLHEN